MTALPYNFRWDRHGRKGQRCRVTARGTMNSCCVEFVDGYRMVTSRNALKRADRSATKPSCADPVIASRAEATCAALDPRCSTFPQVKFK